MGAADIRFAPVTERALLAYRWPGNIRELNNRIVRAVVLGSGEEILPEHCELATEPVGPAYALEALTGETLEAYLDRCRRHYFASLHAVYADDRAKMALAAGMHPSTLREKLKEYGRFRPDEVKNNTWGG